MAEGFSSPSNCSISQELQQLKDLAENARKSPEDAEGPDAEIDIARRSERGSERYSDYLHDRSTETDPDVLSESDTEDHTESDPESQMAFKRPTPRNDSLLISSLSKVRLVLRVVLGVDPRVAFRVVLGVIAGADLDAGIGVEPDAAHR